MQDIIDHRRPPGVPDHGVLPPGLPPGALAGVQQHGCFDNVAFGHQFSEK